MNEKLQKLRDKILDDVAYVLDLSLNPEDKQIRLTNLKLAAEALFYLDGNNVNQTLTTYSFPMQALPDYQRRDCITTTPTITC